MEKKREPEPGRTGTGPNRNRTEPEPTETEPNRTEPWDSCNVTDDDTDDSGRGNRRPLLGGADLISQMVIYYETLSLDLVLSRNRL